MSDSLFNTIHLGLDGKNNANVDDKYVFVDIVAFMNCIRSRGSKFSVNRKRVIKLVDEAAARAEDELRQLKAENAMLKDQLKASREKKRNGSPSTSKEVGAEELSRKKKKSDHDKENSNSTVAK
uniref:Uncharacterized protein n=1 Tax=Haemonchus contortus TaxID=6289 RepID=W6NHG2_HAECO